MVAAMDWLWPIYEEYVRRLAGEEGENSQKALQQCFLSILASSIATLYVMEPVGDTIRFKALGRWGLPNVPELLTDPNAFVANFAGGGKFKVNFHHDNSFVCTHNFRTFGDEGWREMDELHLD